MEWDAGLYNAQHSFVSEYGRELLQYVNREPGQSILDIGCGTGLLTAELAKDGAHVLGIDASASMVKLAKQNYPSISFAVSDALELNFSRMFDTVFSNATFHWIKDQAQLLSLVERALKSHGKLVCEMGAHGNIAKVKNAFRELTKQYGYRYTSPFYNPTAQAYEQLLKEKGFSVELLEEFDRKTPLKPGRDGLQNWVKQFFAGELSNLTKEQQKNVLKAMEETLAPELYRQDRWWLDYRRLRIVAQKID